jgi:ankyrin repeat protein
VDVNDVNEVKRTPFMAATNTSQLALLDVLAQARADVSAVDADGNSALHLAARLGYARATTKLLGLNCVPNRTNRDSKTAFDLTTEATPVYEILAKVTASASSR